MRYLGHPSHPSWLYFKPEPKGHTANGVEGARSDHQGSPAHMLPSSIPLSLVKIYWTTCIFLKGFPISPAYPCHLILLSSIYLITWKCQACLCLLHIEIFCMCCDDVSQGRDPGQLPFSSCFLGCLYQVLRGAGSDNAIHNWTLHL